MAQKPVANALTLELEPVSKPTWIATSTPRTLWFAHDYVPFERGENFAFLGGRDWDPSQMTLPRIITDACEILLLLKDNLAGSPPRAGRALHPRRMVGSLAGPVDRRGAPARHRAARIPGGDPRGRPDRQRGGAGPVRDEGLPRRHVLAGRDPGVHGAHRAHPRGLLRQPGRADRGAHPGRTHRPDPRDEERHEEFFANLVAHCLEYTRDETIAAIAARAADLQVVGADIDAYHDKVQNVADAGIFGPVELRQAISDRITAWGVADEPHCGSSSPASS